MFLNFKYLYKRVLAVGKKYARLSFFFLLLFFVYQNCAKAPEVSSTELAISTSLTTSTAEQDLSETAPEESQGDPNLSMRCNANTLKNHLVLCHNNLEKSLMEDLGWVQETNNTSCYRKGAEFPCESGFLNSTTTTSVRCGRSGYYVQEICGVAQVPSAPWIARGSSGCYQAATKTRCVSYQDAKPQCSEDFKKNLLSGTRRVRLNCSLTLSPGDVVTRPIDIVGEAGSGVKVNCRGAQIDALKITSKYIRGRGENQEWEPPRNVIIKNCNLTGMAMVRGMSINGEGDSVADENGQDFNAYQESSYLAGHTLRAQRNAPRDITFINVKITGAGNIPLYISPGVTRFRMYNSTLNGFSYSVGLYLDAESGFNTFRNNFIGVELRERESTDFKIREQIAVDASSSNRFIENKVSGIGRGGMFFYRNCGEGGVVRHQSPQHNQVINNVFYYNKFDVDLDYQNADCTIDIFGYDFVDPRCVYRKPTIWLGSREGARPYCHLDNGHPFGSSVSNNDFAFHNVIAQNQIVKVDANKAIWNRSGYNLVFENQTIPPMEGLNNFEFPNSGCYHKTGFPKVFLRHGESSQLESVNGQVKCTGKRYTCRSGNLSIENFTCENEGIAGEVHNFQCSISGSNNGCSTLAVCPAGKKLYAAKAACRLEVGTVDPIYVDKHLPWNVLNVIQASDYISEGACLANMTFAQNGSGLLHTRGSSSLVARCSERDDNGGDCHISGQIYCIDGSADQTYQPVYRFYRNSPREHFYTLNYYEGVAAFRLEFIGFHTFKQRQTGTHEIYRCVRTATGKHFVSSSVSCEGQIYEGSYGFIFNASGERRSPLYRFYSSDYEEHLITTNYNEGVASGYTYEGVLGYVPIP